MNKFMDKFISVLGVFVILAAIAGPILYITDVVDGDRGNWTVIQYDNGGCVVATWRTKSLYSRGSQLKFTDSKGNPVIINGPYVCIDVKNEESELLKKLKSVCGESQ